MKYIGLDAHKDIVVASVISDKGKNVKTMHVEASPEGLEKIRQYLGSTEYCVILESSTYAYIPYRFFDDLGTVRTERLMQTQRGTVKEVR